MARAAIYIRVSTEEQADSADEQERGARQWCERKGHEVVRLYRDVGHSGAEWVSRPGVLDLRADAQTTPRPFDLVVVRDADRLGRDAVRLPELLVTFADHDIRAVAWSTDDTLNADGGMAAPAAPADRGGEHREAAVAVDRNHPEWRVPERRRGVPWGWAGNDPAAGSGVT